MKIVKTKVYEGKNIYSYKKCIRIDVNLEGYNETPSKDIEDFNINLVNMIPELRTHRCGIDEDEGFIKRLKEGTYLAHICEHIIIAIQNKLGIDTSYGKAREIIDDDYYIVFQYMYPKVGIETAKLAVDIINALIEKEPINYEERIKLLEKFLSEEEIGPSTRAICDAANSIGLPVLKLGEGNFYQIGYGKQGRIIEASIGSNTSCIAVDISCDKLLTKELLSLQSIPVAKGCKVFNILNILKEADDIGYPVVLKPQYGNQGKGVILNIKNKKELLEAYSKLIEKYNDLILEKYCEGKDYRVCVVNNKVVAASLRIPPFVIGNGIDNVLNLIKRLNENPLRGEDHEKPLTKIKIDDELIKFIKEQGYEIESVLNKDKVLYLRRNANLSTGGEAIDCTDIICDENKEICIRAAKALGLDICGIDICSKDISIPLKGNGVVMEVNSAPGLRMHIYPSKGKSRDVGKEVINMLYNNDPKNIPIIAITGTNGKTTTTRVISHTFSKMGYIVGMTSTDGIYINGQCIDDGDDTGVESAKSILLNKDVDIAVLETARGGIIKKGLAYDEADVAIITNITEDHLGIDNINTMEDLCYVKSLVAEAVKENGYAVINADDKWSRKVIDRIKANKIYFSKDKNNDLILQEINNGGIVVYLEDEKIIVNNKGRIYNICNIKDVPITLNGALEFNIENILGICGALVGIGVDYCMIRNGIESYKLNTRENLGRFNCYDVNGINVILDYGHNIEGYKAVLSCVKNINNGKVCGVIGIPGDRSDEMAKSIGELSSRFLDKIIIKEDREKRGRASGEMAKVILEGIKTSLKKVDVEVILDEVEAFKKALSVSKQGDTVIVFFEEIKPLINVIEEINLRNNEEKHLKFGFN
ncbi:cyanophycin synthetase [Clostridium carnis]